MNNKWQAQVYVKWNKKWPREWAQAKSWDWLKEWPEVKNAWSTMGDWDCILWVEVDSPAKLEDFVCNRLGGKEWVEKTESHWAREVWNHAA